MIRNLQFVCLLALLSGLPCSNYASNINPGEDKWVVTDQPYFEVRNPESIKDVILGGPAIASCEAGEIKGKQHLVHTNADGTTTDGPDEDLGVEKIDFSWTVSPSGEADTGSTANFTPTKVGVYEITFMAKGVAHGKDGEDYKVEQPSEVPTTVVVTTCQYGPWQKDKTPILTVTSGELKPELIGTTFSAVNSYAITKGTKKKVPIEGNCTNIFADWYLNKPTVTWVAKDDKGVTVDGPKQAAVIAISPSKGTIKADFKPSKPGKYTIVFNASAQSTDPAATVTATGTVTIYAYDVVLGSLGVGGSTENVVDTDPTIIKLQATALISSVFQIIPTSLDATQIPDLNVRLVQDVVADRVLYYRGRTTFPTKLVISTQGAKALDKVIDENPLKNLSQIALSAGDVPHEPRERSIYNKITVNDTFSLYMQFRTDKTNWKTVGKAVWTFTGSASGGTTVGSWTGSATASSANGTASTELPVLSPSIQTFPGKQE